MGYLNSVLQSSSQVHSEDRPVSCGGLRTCTIPVEGRLDPRLAYTAWAEIEQLQWSSSQPDWVALAFSTKLQILRVVWRRRQRHFDHGKANGREFRRSGTGFKGHRMQNYGVDTDGNSTLTTVEKRNENGEDVKPSGEAVKVEDKGSTSAVKDLRKSNGGNIHKGSFGDFNENGTSDFDSELRPSVRVDDKYDAIKEKSLSYGKNLVVSKEKTLSVAETAIKYPSRLHEKFAFLEGKVNRIATDIKRTKEILAMRLRFRALRRLWVM